jgi:gliding motility-associated-like protein
LFDDLLPGQEYRIYVADAHDCRLEQDFIMPVPYENMASLPASIDLRLGSTYKIQPELNIPESLLANVRWSPGDHLSCVNCLEPEIQAWKEMTYSLHLKDIFGCSDEISMQVNIDRSIDLFVPNAFSPNKDGLNDRFVIYGNAAEVSQVLIFQIYDRWGNLLYTARNFAVNDETAGWDGYFRGRLMNTGAYVYHTQLELMDGSTQTRSGQVTLVK